jgi:hypothetical protein
VFKWGSIVFPLVSGAFRTFVDNLAILFPRALVYAVLIQGGLSVQRARSLSILGLRSNPEKIE